MNQLPPVTARFRKDVDAIVALIDQMHHPDTTDEQREQLLAQAVEQRRDAVRTMRADQAELIQFTERDREPSPQPVPSPRRDWQDWEDELAPAVAWQDAW